MLKKVIVIAATSCLSLSAYSLNIKNNLNEDTLNKAVSEMLPYEKEYVPYLLKEFSDFECLNTSNSGKINCGGINKLLIKEDENNLNVILTGYALRNDFSYVEPFFVSKNGLNITPVNIKVNSDGDGVSVVNKNIRSLNKGFFEVTYSFAKKELNNLGSIIFSSEKNDHPFLYGNSINGTVPGIVSVENGLNFNVERNNEGGSFKIVFSDKPNELKRENVVGKEVVTVVRSLSLDNINIANNIQNPARLKTIINVSSNSNKDFNLGEVTFPNSYLINVSTNNFLKQNGNELIASIGIGNNEIVLEELIGTNNFKFDVKNKVNGADSEIWIVENTPRWSAPLGAFPISSEDIRIPSELRNKNAYLVKDSITINQTPISVSKNINSLSNERISFLKSKNEINSWDSYKLTINENSMNNVLSLNEALKNKIVMNAATLNGKEIPVYEKDNVPYIKVTESGDYSFQYTSKDLNANSMNISSQKDSPLTWTLMTNPRERLLWVNGANFDGTELSNWSFYSIFWLVFFGFLIWKLINWRLSLAMIGSFILLDSIFGHVLSVFWAFFITAYLYFELVKKDVEMTKKLNPVTFLIATSLIFIIPNSVKFVKVELESIINPMAEVYRDMSRNSIFEMFNGRAKSTIFSTDDFTQKFSNDETLENINIDDAPFRMKNLEMAQMSISAPMMTMPKAPAPVEIAKDQIYTSQVMRDKPIINPFYTYFNRNLKATYVGNYPESVKPVVAGKWIVNLVGILQILTVLFICYLGAIMFMAGLKNDKELLKKQFFLKDNNLKLKG